MAIDSSDPDYVNALARGLAIITAFGHNSEALSLSDVAEKTRLSRGTARRFLLTLESLGYLRFDGKTFRLTPKTLDLGYSYLSSLPLLKAAHPIMQDVVSKLGESCALGVLDGHDVVYIARIPPKTFSFINVPIGTRMPAHLNAMGQVLLSELSEGELEIYLSVARLPATTKFALVDPAAIRKQIARVAKDQYAISDQQLQIGMRSIAVPVRSRSGRTDVAINIAAGDKPVSKKELIDGYLPVLRQAAFQIGQAIYT